MIDISIIVPIFKVENYLRRSIDGLLAQTHKNFELILVNDGSPDNCIEICEYYRRMDRRVKVINQENKGAGVARNRGLASAKGKYIYFCDADDFVEPTLIEDNYCLAEKYQANMVIFGYYVENHTKHGQSSMSKSYQTLFMESKRDFRNEFTNLFNEHILYTLWNKLYKREYLLRQECSFGNQKVGEDTLFNYDVYENLDRVLCIEDKYYHYINERADSAINRYSENKFQMRYEETSKLEGLLEKWGNINRYNQLILEDWLNTLSAGLHNLIVAECPLDDTEKKKEIERIINTPKIKALLNEISPGDISNLFMKTEVQLLKNNQISLALSLLKFKRFVKSKK